jgi:hypothetical protein
MFHHTSADVCDPNIARTHKTRRSRQHDREHQVERMQYERKLERISCFHFILALQTALVRGFGYGLDEFAVPDTWSLTPLLRCETRFRDPVSQRFVIWNKETRHLRQDCGSIVGR